MFEFRVAGDWPPAWRACENTAACWRASDQFERANGDIHREYELARSRELSPVARAALG